MNVAKLRKLLATYDDDAEVVVEDENSIETKIIKEVKKESCWTVVIKTS